MSQDKQPDGGAEAGPEPCPFCGHLVLGGADQCPRCLLPLDAATRQRMCRQIGPWFVLDANHPSAPGVQWARLAAMIDQGKVTPETVIRGPTTGGTWRFAARTPSVATRLGVCWSCQAALADRAGRRCPGCGVVLNGPEDAPPAEGQSGEPPGAIEDLVKAAGAAPSGQPAGADGQSAVLLTEPHPSRRVQAIGVVAAVVSLGLLVGGALVLGWKGPDPASSGGPGRGAGPGPGERTPPDPPGEYRPEGAKPPAPIPGAMPGEMFPEVPEYRSPPAGGGTSRPAGLTDQRRRAAEAYDQARAKHAAGDLMGAQWALVDMLNSHSPRTWPAGAEALLKTVQKEILSATRPAGALSPQQLADQRRGAQALFDQAAALEARGELMAAQETLVKMLNTHDRQAWPAGAAERLKAVQAKVLSAARDDVPPPAELARQRRSAAALFEQAGLAESRREYMGAQRLLLEVLNDHHPAAHPAGAVEALKRVQKVLRAPATEPEFFGK